MLGEEYGTVQPTSGLSATHEEYREARGKKPVIAFVQDGILAAKNNKRLSSPRFRGGEGGLFRGGFPDARGLQVGITRALHDFELANAIGPLDPQALTTKAVGMLPAEIRNNYSGSTGLRECLEKGFTGRRLMIQARDVDREEPWPDGQDRQEDQTIPV